LFAHDLTTGVTTLASKNQSGGGSGSDPALFHDPVISGDGMVLAFRSTASDLIADDVNGIGGPYLYALGGSPASPQRPSGQFNRGSRGLEAARGKPGRGFFRFSSVVQPSLVIGHFRVPPSARTATTDRSAGSGKR